MWYKMVMWHKNNDENNVVQYVIVAQKLIKNNGEEVI